MQCERCSRELGETHTVILDGEKKSVCSQCYEKLKKEYEAKKTCDDCFYFEEDEDRETETPWGDSKSLCKKIDSHLAPDWIGFVDYYVQREECVHYLTKKEYEQQALRGTLGAAREGEQATKETHIIRENTVIVKIRCPYCGKLYDETLDTCVHCGGKR